MTTQSLTVLYRSASDTASTLALLAERGDKDALELLEYVQWASNALAEKLKRRLKEQKERLNENSC